MRKPLVYKDQLGLGWVFSCRAHNTWVWCETWSIAYEVGAGHVCMVPHPRRRTSAHPLHMEVPC